MGFEAHYDRTNYSAFRRLLTETGFKGIDIQPGYFSSAYFRFFVPAYLVSLGFDCIRYALGIKNLASYYLIVARA